MYLDLTVLKFFEINKKIIKNAKFKIKKLVNFS